MCNSTVVVVNVGVSFARQATRPSIYILLKQGIIRHKKRKKLNIDIFLMFIIRRMQRYVLKICKMHTKAIRIGREAINRQ